MPVAAPVDWQELQDVESAAAFTIADVEQLLKRASSRKLKNWGAGAQRLPMLR
jgi:bifunctional non-homologous end joining protein LigD